MIHDRLEHWRHYFPAGSVWETAFEYLQSLRPDAPEADRVALDGAAVFARVMRYPTRAPGEAVLEAHDAYIDIQMTLEGDEGIAWHPRAALEIATPYDPETDAVFFRDPGPPPALVRNVPGVFSVFFPWDAHMAQLASASGPAPVRKAVVKVAAARALPDLERRP